MRTIIVTGGREYADAERVAATLELLAPDLVVEGGAMGADLLARDWAEQHAVRVVTVKADWKKHGKAAGPIRNREMLTAYPGALVVAFKGGRGTANCVATAIELGRLVLEVRQ